MASRALLLRNLNTVKQVEHLQFLSSDQQLEMLLPGNHSSHYREGALEAIAQYRFVFNRIRLNMMSGEAQRKSPSTYMLMQTVNGEESLVRIIRPDTDTDECANGFGQCE